MARVLAVRQRVGVTRDPLLRVVRWSSVALCVLVAWTESAHAEPSATNREPPRDGTKVEEPREPAALSTPTTSDRAVASILVIVPGLVLHGAGSHALGKRATARRLLELELLGLVLGGLGAGLLFASGSARDFEGPGALVALAGAGLFTLSFTGDLFSVLTPPGGLGRDPGWTPTFESELGYRHVFDPRFDYESFVVTGLTGRLGRFRLAPSLWSSANDAHQLGRAELAYRLHGPLPGSRTPSGSFVDVAVAFSGQRFGFEDFDVVTGEAELEGRWDWGDYDAGLAGAFVDFGVGAATQRHRFDAAPDEELRRTFLLASFGFGLYLGDQTPHGGFVRAYYDHRHDGPVGGALAFGIGRDPLGFLGLEALYYFAERWGARLDARWGSAFLVGASGVFRYGGDE